MSECNLTANKQDAAERTLNAGITLYEMNKMLISQMPAWTKEQIADKGRKALESYYNCEVGHYMLLCKDKSYYTVFEWNESENTGFIDATLEIICDLGYIRDMGQNDDGVFEIWITPFKEEETYAFFLFPYDLGVVYYA